MWKVIVMAAALALRAPVEDRALGRAAVLRMALETTGILGGGAALATAAAALGAQGALLRRPLEFEADPLAAQLRSSNELAPSRRRLEAEWHALIDGYNRRLQRKLRWKRRAWNVLGFAVLVAGYAFIGYVRRFDAKNRHTLR